MPEKRCDREDCGRVFDVDEGDLGAEEVRCPYCGHSQAAPTATATVATDDSDATTAETATLTASEGVVVTITIEVTPRG